MVDLNGDRPPPKSGEPLIDLWMICIVALLREIKIKKAKNIIDTRNRYEKNICGILTNDGEIHLNDSRHRKIKEPITLTLIHETLHYLMPELPERYIKRFEKILYIRFTDAQKRYIRSFIPKHTVAPTTIVK